MTHLVAFEALAHLSALSLRGYFHVCPVKTKQISSHMPLQSIRVLKDILGLAELCTFTGLGVKEPPGIMSHQFPDPWDRHMGDGQGFGPASSCSQPASPQQEARLAVVPGQLHPSLQVGHQERP